MGANMILFLALLVLASMLPSRDAAMVKRQTEACPDQCKDKPLEISFIVDSSSSIRQVNFTTSLWFVENFINRFDIGPNKVRVSMVTYGEGVYQQHAFGLNAHLDKQELGEAISSIQWENGRATETGQAINWFMTHQHPAARPGIRHVLVVITDGNSQEPDITKDAARRAADAGLDVFAIGVGEKVREQELHNIASDGSRHVFSVLSYNSLNDIVLRLAYETCDIGPIPPCQFDPVDLVFVIDSSVSIEQGNFTLGLRFIYEFLEPFTINPSSVRVAAIMFGDQVYTQHVIPFDMYRNKKDTQDAILALPWMKGTSTEIGDGIEYVVENFMPRTRSHAAHLCIVITDGDSQNKRRTARMAQKARTAGLTMYAVGIGEVLAQELLNIAGDQSRVLSTDTYRTLNTLKDVLTDKTCAGIETSIQQQRRYFSPPTPVRK